MTTPEILGDGDTFDLRPEASDLKEADDYWFREKLPSSRYQPPIFFSFPTPVSREQFEMVKALYRLLSSQHLTPRTLGVNEYNFKEPLAAVRRLLNQSYGLLAVAFKKTTVTQGSTIRKRDEEAPKHEDLAGLGLTSPWVQIETAMAYQINLPILLLREHDVNDDGLLQEGVIVHHMPVFNLSRGTAGFFRDRPFNAALDQFVKDVNDAAFGTERRSPGRLTPLVVVTRALDRNCCLPHWSNARPSMEEMRSVHGRVAGSSSAHCRLSARRRVAGGCSRHRRVRPSAHEFGAA